MDQQSINKLVWAGQIWWWSFWEGAKGSIDLYSRDRHRNILGAKLFRVEWLARRQDNCVGRYFIGKIGHIFVSLTPVFNHFN